MQNMLKLNVIIRFAQSTMYYSMSHMENKVVCHYCYYTEQKYKCNTFVFVPIFHELNSKI